jgi:hypothetical protein
MYSSESQPIFWRNILPPSAGSKNKPHKTPAEAGCKLSLVLKIPWVSHEFIMPSLLRGSPFNPENGSNMFF